MKAPSNKSKSGNGQSSYASKPKKSSDSKKSSELKHDLKQRVGKDGVVKKSKKRAQRIPTDDGMRYNVELNKYVKKVVKVAAVAKKTSVNDAKDKRDERREEVLASVSQQREEKKISKSATFWKLQTQKANDKREGKKSAAEDFEVVPVEDEMGWESGSDLLSDDESEPMADTGIDMESLESDSEEDLGQLHQSKSTKSMANVPQIKTFTRVADKVQDKFKKAPEDLKQDVESYDLDADADAEHSMAEVLPDVLHDKDQEAEVTEDEDDEFDESGDDEADSAKKAIKSGKKSGGFQSMGLSFPVFKAIGHVGYKIPTPIQRKAIPLILEGGDVVAMARTGSGKTAAFLIPLLERLKAHSAKVGVRALILSPSRELATQTQRFCKDLGKYTDLRTCVFVGGDNMDTQFSALASNPDVIIATPGRLMHLIIEAKLELKCVEFLVFDEADRLFEMGFAEQLREIVGRIPPSRQTILVDFARAGLQNPSLIRLDVDTKISEDLQMYFYTVKNEEKEGSLIYLLTNVIPREQQVVVFVATKHHVEYIHQLLLSNGFLSTYIYGTLDPIARKIHLARFRHNKVKLLVVTDVAARGIDVPLLDNVINYNFPASSKVFVHRVGRTARAGKKGSAWSLVASEEVPYMLDLQLFTGRPLIYADVAVDMDYTKQLVFGRMPGAVSLSVESMSVLVKGNFQLESMRESSKGGYKMYLRSRPAATKASHSRSKQVASHALGVHPMFADDQTMVEKEREDLVSAISNFRPQESVFELGKKGRTSTEALLMQKRRTQMAGAIIKNRETKKNINANELERQKKAIMQSSLEEANDFEGFQDLKRKRDTGKDKDFYLAYRPADDATEAGYAVHDASFNAQANKASLELIPDDELMKKKPMQTWDSKKHRFTSSQVGGDNKKRIRTENGTLVPATFQSDRFALWQKKTKVDMPRAGEHELSGAASMAQVTTRFRHNSQTAPKSDSKSFKRKMDTEETKWRKEGLTGETLVQAKSEWMKTKGVETPQKRHVAGAKGELKDVFQIAKERDALDKRREKTGRHSHIVGKKSGTSSRGGSSSRGGGSSSRGGTSRGGSSSRGSSRGGSSSRGSSRGGSSSRGSSRGGSRGGRGGSSRGGR